MISQASLDDLNSRLPQPLPMNRFRPNIVVDGLPAYGEDDVHEFATDGVTLRGVKPCTRCTITTTNQATAEREGEEPLRTLRSYRFSRELKGVLFGQNPILMQGVGAANCRWVSELKVSWKAQCDELMLAPQRTDGNAIPAVRRLFSALRARGASDPSLSQPKRPSRGRILGDLALHGGYVRSDATNDSAFPVVANQRAFGIESSSCASRLLDCTGSQRPSRHFYRRIRVALSGRDRRIALGCHNAARLGCCNYRTESLPLSMCAASQHDDAVHAPRSCDAKWQ